MLQDRKYLVVCNRYFKKCNEIQTTYDYLLPCSASSLWSKSAAIQTWCGVNGYSSQISWVGLETNPNGVQLPSTHFRPGLGVGFRAKIASSGKFYIPVNINFNLNAFCRENQWSRIDPAKQISFVAVQVIIMIIGTNNLYLTPAIGLYASKMAGLRGRALCLKCL